MLFAVTNTSDDQFNLLLPAPPLPADQPFIPARLVNEYAYCPRLAYLMWSQAEWADTADTVDGRRVHQRADTQSAPLPPPDDIAQPVTRRAITLSSATLGVIAKIDIAEAEDGAVIPVDYKRGKRPHVAQGAYEPERIQVCLQAVLLEEHGYRVPEAGIWYAESRERVRIVLDDALRALTHQAVAGLRLIAAQGRIPPPLQDSPKCPRCALVSICLPDETAALTGSSLAPRPIAVPAEEAVPLIVQSQRARINKDGDTLRITDEDVGETTARINEISDLLLFGNVNITTPALAALLEREIPVTFLSHGGWFRGIAHGLGHRNVELRAAQYRLSFDDAACLRFARDLVAAKIMNQRTILRRNGPDTPEHAEALTHLMAARRSAGRAASIQALLGIEGDAAAVYFRAFAGLLKPPAKDEATWAAFQFETRNRRPPRDPVNAMLSLAYALLARHLTVALASVGFDAWRGFYHAPRYGRPSLALDVMEPFRPIIADSVVLSVVNMGEVSASDFVSAVTGVALTSAGRRRFIEAFERRIAQEVTHPLFGYRLSMRRLLLVQARLLSRFLLGELPTYPHHLPR